MDTLLDAIRAAIAADATDETKATGASACRMILTALDAKVDEPLAPPASTHPPDLIANAVAMLRGVPADQLLDLAIARLRAALPTGESVTPVSPLRLQLVPLPSLPRRTAP